MQSNRLLLLALLAGATLLTACEPDKPEPPKAATAAPAPASAAPAAPAAGQELNQAIQAPLDRARAVEDQVLDAQKAQDAAMEKQQEN